MMKKFVSTRGWVVRVAAVSAAVCLGQVVTGCATGGSFAGGASSDVVAMAHLHGKVHGGQQPVFNSSIGLYAAGTSAYGTASANLLTTPVSTGADGSFDISLDYNCPTPTSLMYLTATGGDPTGLASTSTNNTAIQMVAVLGQCQNLSSATFISVNELTTVAAAFGLGQFFSPTFGATSADGFGAPLSNVIGLTNAFATAHNLVNVTTGAVTPTTAATGTNYFLQVNDQQKLDTIANILAACVNQTSVTSDTNCSTLFADATPTNAPRTSTAATQATDTLQAAVYLSLNPTSVNASGSNLAAVYSLASGTPPFQPTLSSVPTDWTLALQYSGTGINYLSSAAVDANGDLWFSNTNPTGGAVMLNGGTGTVGGTVGVTGGVIGFYSKLGTVTANASRQVAIDLNGKAWFATYTANTADNKYYLLRAVGGTGVEATFPLPTGPTLPYAIAIDAANTVLTTTANTRIDSVAGAAATGTVTTDTVNLGPSSGAASLTLNGSRVAFAPANGGSTLAEFNAGTLAIVTGSPFSPTGLASAYGSALDANGRLLIANKSGTSLITVSGTTYGSISSSCLNQPQFVAVDGNNNIWVSNTGTTSETVNGTAGVAVTTVCEFNSAGTLISNSVGFGPHNITTGRGIAIDPSGNVWVTSYSNAVSTVSQIVGAAVPVVTPISVATKNGTQGTRP